MKSPNPHPKTNHERQACYGLRIESHAIQLAIAIPDGPERFRLEFDDVQCGHSAGWMSRRGAEEFESALETLIERHEIGRSPIAVSLDGDFCVTRVVMGSSAEVDAELKTLADRIPRYLQLGPGEKVTGSARMTIEPGLQYVVTGVVNKSLIQNIYDAFRGAGVEVAWIEPSLISLARLVGRDQEIGDRPVLVADGMGKQWDVGIACAGRLLLDYRPAAAHNTSAFCDALTSHFSRLKRYCFRHRGISSEDLNELLVCGSPEKTEGLLKAFAASSPLTPRLMEVPSIPHLYSIEEAFQTSNYVPPVATVFPMMIGTNANEVPDLFEQVRRAPDLTWGQRLIHQCWPIAVASLTLIVAYGLVTRERRQHEHLTAGRAAMESEISISQAKFTSLTKQRSELNHLESIAKNLEEPDWNQMLRFVTKSLPESMKLEEFRVDSGTAILINGTTMDETLIYDLINTFRRLPGIGQVALNGTIPDLESQTTRFTVRLAIQPTSKAVATVSTTASLKEVSIDSSSLGLPPQGWEDSDVQ